MITIVGEALVDLVIDPGGHVVAALGGAPFNTARACGRLGVDVAFTGALSDDRFGSMLRAQLVADGVDVSHASVVTAPTTLAAAELDESGAANYRFYVDGTSAPSLTSLPAPPDGGMVFTGGLGLALEPMAATVERLVGAVSGSSLVVIDVNCRPLVIADRDAYVARVGRVVARSHVVKVSDEDLAYLAPGVDPLEAARELRSRGPRAVLVTGGGEGVHVLTAAGERFVPVDPVAVVDTIGAGDTFGGALMAWLTINGLADGQLGNGQLGNGQLGDPDLLARAVHAANVAAGITCTRRGADPPHLDDLPPHWPT